MISGRNRYRKLLCRILAKALEINDPGRPKRPHTVRGWSGARGAKAEVGVVCPVTFGDALAQSNAAVTINKAVITVKVS